METSAEAAAASTLEVAVGLAAARGGGAMANPNSFNFFSVLNSNFINLRDNLFNAW
jgi:hypothetical protein